MRSVQLGLILSVFLQLHYSAALPVSRYNSLQRRADNDPPKDLTVSKDLKWGTGTTPKGAETFHTDSHGGAHVDPSHQVAQKGMQKEHGVEQEEVAHAASGHIPPGADPKEHLKDVKKAVDDPANVMQLGGPANRKKAVLMTGKTPHEDPAAVKEATQYMDHLHGSSAHHDATKKIGDELHKATGGAVDSKQFQEEHQKKLAEASQRGKDLLAKGEVKDKSQGGDGCARRRKRGLETRNCGGKHGAAGHHETPHKQAPTTHTGTHAKGTGHKRSIRYRREFVR